jgi:hypothetical protein
VADDAGALLVRSGLVSSSALDEARSRVASQGGTLGEQLVAAGVVSDDQLTDFYRQRLLVPQVNPNTLARLSHKVVTSIPSEMAIELRAIPVSLDGDNNLTVAMSDPSDRHAVDEISFFTGTYVVRAVATQMQIAWCLAHYYGHVTLLGERLIQPQTPGIEAEAAAAPAKPAASTPASTQANPGAATTPARAKGVTGKINASRHRAVAPITGPTPVVRPVSSDFDLAVLEAKAVDDKITETMAAVTPPPDAMPAESPSTSAGAQPPPAQPPTPPDEPEDEIHIVEADEPQTRSISGEIRPVRQRAASIKPPMPAPHLADDEDDEPMISVEESPEDDGKGPRMMPVRRRVKSDPPELKARAGEVSLDERPDRTIDDHPRIIIDDEALVPAGPVAGELRAITHRDPEPPIPESTIEVDDTSVGVVLEDLAEDVSEPVLLEVRRTTDLPLATLRAPSNEDGMDTTDDEVVVLESRKRAPTPRPDKKTQMGVGPIAAFTRLSRRSVPARPPASPAARGSDDGDDEPTNVEGRTLPRDEDRTDRTLAAPPADRDEDTNPQRPRPVIIRPRGSSVRPPMVPRPRTGKPDASPDELDEDEITAGPATSVMSAIELDDLIPERSDAVIPAHLERRRPASDAVDDGWGTTNPPPLLGALPGVDENGEGEDGSRIPAANVNAAPLIAAPPVPPDSARSAPGLADASTPNLVRALEEATARSVQLLQAIERTQDRDAVVTLMIDHLAESHMRAGFFSIRPVAGAGKAGELAVFKIEPGPPLPSSPTLRLDRPSTLQDVVGTRLPYRGPMHDDTSRSFLAGVLGACPPEILLVPVAVRERVVGVLFGEHRLRHTFDDQLALAARAAGLALERILLAKRG